VPVKTVIITGEWLQSIVDYLGAVLTFRSTFSNRTSINHKIYRIGNGADKTSGATEYDITEKTINPLGGWVRYGVIQNE